MTNTIPNTQASIILEEGPIPFGMGCDKAIPECVTMICFNTLEMNVSTKSNRDWCTFDEASSLIFLNINDWPA